MLTTYIKRLRRFWKLRQPNPQQNQFTLRRRDFILLAGWGLFSLKPARGLAESLSASRRLANSPLSPITIGPTLDAFLDILIPADEFTPSASQTGMTIHMLNDAKNDTLYNKLLTLGCKWLDLQTVIPFNQLPENTKIRIVEWMSQAESNSLPRKFFELHRARAMQYYYSDTRSWVSLPVTRPPQPLGYPDFEG